MVQLDGWRDPAVALALGAQRMLLQIGCAISRPGFRVPPLGCAGALAVIDAPVGSASTPSDEIAATRHEAVALRS